MLDCLIQSVHGLLNKPQELSVAEFVERFERPRLPVVITGLCDGWRAAKDWNEDTLLQRYGDHKFKVMLAPFACGEEPSLYSLCLRHPHIRMLGVKLRFSGSMEHILVFEKLTATAT